MRKKRLVFIVTLILSLIALFVAFFVAKHKILYHFAVVDNGKIYRSGTLSNLGLKWVHAKTGFRTIINLRTNRENQESWYQVEGDFCAKNNIKLVDLPLSEDIPPNADQIKRFLDIVNDPENLPAIIHCHQGVTRTSMMVAVYKIAVQKQQNEYVFKTIKTFGHSFEKPDKKAVKNFILSFNKCSHFGFQNVSKSD